MIDRTEDQIHHLLELQDAHEQRLRILLVQNAQRGSGAPAETLIEVRSIQTTILQLAVQIGKLQTSATQAEHREFTATNTNDLSDVSLQLSSSTDLIRKIQQTTLEQLVQWFDENSQLRESRQRMTTIFYFTVVIMLAIDILIRFWK